MLTFISLTPLFSNWMSIWPVKNLQKPSKILFWVVWCRNLGKEGWLQKNECSVWVCFKSCTIFCVRFDIWCYAVECSFECITEASGSIHSGTIEVTVSSMYSTTSEDHFTFKVVFFVFPEAVSIMIIFTLLCHCIISFNGIICTDWSQGMVRLLTSGNLIAHQLNHIRSCICLL